MAHEDHYFNIQRLYECFNLTLLADCDIDIGTYLKAYEELRKFCVLLGSVFSFVASEIDEKSQIMFNLHSQEKENFSTLKRMIEYERRSNLLENNGNYVSGCRTLLRLHRGLDFIRTFLRRINDLDLEQGTGSVGSESYSETLAYFHAWYIRQLAFIAMKLLPTKRKLFNMVCGTEERIREAQEVLPLMLEVMDEVYKRTESCYRTNDLLSLP